MIKQTVINEMNDAELKDKLSTEIASLEKMRMNHAVSPLENPLKLRVTRRNVARLTTELNKRNQAKA
jgi:large subunit ribosomal protein L29